MRIVETLAWHVRASVLDLQTRYDLNPPTIKKCKVVLDAILTTALNDQVTMLHAGKGVKTPPVATKPRRIITAEQYDRIHANLGDETMKLLVETDIETGFALGRADRTTGQGPGPREPRPDDRPRRRLPDGQD